MHHREKWMGGAVLTSLLLAAPVGAVEEERPLEVELQEMEDSAPEETLEVVQAEEETLESVVLDDSPRLRFALQGGVSVGYAGGLINLEHEVAAVGGGLSVGVEAGLQASRNWAVLVRAEASTAGLINQAGAFAMLEYSPTALLSLGAGFGADTFGMISLLRSSTWRTHWRGLSVPLSLSFNFNNKEKFETGGRRTTVRLQLLAVPGMEPDTGIGGFRMGTYVGVTWM